MVGVAVMKNHENTITSGSSINVVDTPNGRTPDHQHAPRFPMTTIDANSPASTAVAPPVDNYLTYTKGVLSWALTLDHKRIGVMYLFAVLLSFLLGGIFALLVRTELLTPGATFPASTRTPTTTSSPCTGRSWCSW